MTCACCGKDFWVKDLNVFIMGFIRRHGPVSDDVVINCCIQEKLCNRETVLVKLSGLRKKSLIDYDMVERVRRWRVL